MITKTTLPLNGSAIAQNATSTTPWIPWHNTELILGVDNPVMWYYATSAGAPSVTITAYVTPFECANENTNPALPISGGSNYQTVTILTATVITLDAWTEVVLPDAFSQYPWKWVKFAVAEQNVAAITAFYLALFRKVHS